MKDMQKLFNQTYKQVDEYFRLNNLLETFDGFCNLPEVTLLIQEYYEKAYHYLGLLISDEKTLQKFTLEDFRFDVIANLKFNIYMEIHQSLDLVKDIPDIRNILIKRIKRNFESSKFIKQYVDFTEEICKKLSDLSISQFLEENSSPQN